jgi:uncharacterized protein YciI
MPKETYVVIAYDATDTDAPQRRLNARPEHLVALQVAKNAGLVKLAVALQNDAGTAAIGSLVVLEADAYQAVQTYLDAEAYVRCGVWERVTVHKGVIPPLFAL